jgi:hypothetical protein
MFEEFANMLGVEWKIVVAGTPIIIFLVNALKDVIDLKGKKQILGIVVGLSMIIGFMGGYPDTIGIFSTSFFLFAMSVGAWKSGKIIAHKIGNNK